MKKISIAIDGPAGAGKSTAAKAVAKALDLKYLDTGAMYRTVALKAITDGIDTLDEKKVSRLAGNINMEVIFNGDVQQMYLDGKNVTDRIREKDVTIGSSNIAVVPKVREKMVEMQRKIAKKAGIVMDGRDIGTYVLPDADLKIYLDASVEERANRRFRELKKKNRNNLSIEEIKKDIEYRDKNDSSRKFAPLCAADDAVILDTTDMTVNEVTEKIMLLVENL